MIRQFAAGLLERVFPSDDAAPPKHGSAEYWRVMYNDILEAYLSLVDDRNREKSRADAAEKRADRLTEAHRIADEHIQNKILELEKSNVDLLVQLGSARHMLEEHVPCAQCGYLQWCDKQKARIAELEQQLADYSEAKRLLFEEFNNEVSLSSTVSELVTKLAEELDSAREKARTPGEEFRAANALTVGAECQRLRKQVSDLEQQLAQTSIVGHSEGRRCNRNPCPGLLATVHEGEGCSCHINPPCHYCTSGHVECPECGWSENEKEADGHDA